ncbi:hypothetical protein VPH35_060613 [Triticum aestivum]
MTSDYAVCVLHYVWIARSSYLDRVKTTLIDGDGFLSCWSNCIFRLFFQVYKQQCNNSRNLHLNTALFSGIQISRLKSTSPHNLQPSTIMLCFMFYDQVVICWCGAALL